MVAAQQGDAATALQLITEARDRCVRLDAYLWVEGYRLDALCALAVEQGRPEAARWIEDLEALATRTGMREPVARAYAHRGRLGDRVGRRSAGPGGRGRQPALRRLERTDLAPAVRFGVHLPLMDFGDQRFAVEHLVEYVETATALGFDAVSSTTTWCSACHGWTALLPRGGGVLFRRRAVVHNGGESGRSRPAALAKVLAGLDVLSGGRVTAGLGPGSSGRDYATVGFRSRNGGRASTRR